MKNLTMENYACNSLSHLNRRTLLKAAGLSGLSWLTPVAHRLARAEENAPKGKQPQSVILLWMQGGPSQLETFDPHPGAMIGGEAKAIKTAARDVKIASGLGNLAEVMDRVTLVRNVVSREGDHERATYNVKTGWRPDPTLVHPSIGAILCHELPVGSAEIPRHVSILPGQWSGRGGFLGDKFDAFRVPDPIQPIPDVARRVSEERFQERLDDLNVIENSFARGRMAELDKRKTLHLSTIAAARKMMTSDQLKAFDITSEPQSLRDEFGNTPFGRGCLAAARLVEVGVRCVEVTLNGWDTHANNHEFTSNRAEILDPAFAALIRELERRELLESTTIICGGEFGRTPRINPAGGRDHWPHGFSIALAGGAIRPGQAIGQTSPDGEKLEYPEDDEAKRKPGDNITVADIHATVLHTLGVDYEQEFDTPVGRPMKLSKGRVVKELLASEYSYSN